FEEALNWSIGGLAVFDQVNPLALIKSKGKKSSSTGLAYNFFLNRASNELGLQNQNVDTVYLQNIWLSAYFPVLLPNSNVQEWVVAEKLLIENPFLLRSSAFRDEYLINLNGWPRWALDRLIEISSQSDLLDEPLVQLIRNRADRQFSQINDSIGNSYPGLRNGIRNSVAEYNHLSLPDDLFIPRLPNVDPGENAGFRIYPNPVQENLFIHPEELQGLSKIFELTYEINSISGQSVKVGKVQSLVDFVIPVSHFPAGIYTICLRDVKRFYGTRKFIILRP
ncbi:MAG: T9SS type A sorting domain-containing protein, partial [Bacteroidota bacterium]|nr:T9SS type A sorting domain-containing protein [Bacteroidota bacterium]